MPDAADKSLVFRRTGKGDQEYKERAPTRRWLALVTVDGRSSVSQLERIYDMLPTLAEELASLERDGCVRPIRRTSSVPEVEAAEAAVAPDDVAEIDLDFIEEATPPPAAAPARSDSRAAAPPPPAAAPLPPPPAAERARPAAPRLPGIALGKLLRRVLLGAIAAVFAAVAAVFLMPMDRYAPRVEELASQALGEPVSIRGLQLTLAPLPALKISGITIGKTGQVSIAKALAVPSISSWYSPEKVFPRVALEGVTLVREAMPLVAGLANAKDGPFRQVRVSGLTLDLDKTLVGPMSAELEFRPGAGMVGGRLKADVGGTDVSVTADQGRLHMEFHAKAVATPGTFPLLLDGADARLTLGPDSLAIREFQARLYDGRVRGAGDLRWKDAWQLDATVTAEGLSLPDVLAVFSPTARWEGRLGGELRYQASSAQFGELLEEPRYEFALQVAKGILKGANAEAALTNPRTPSRGGETRFDELTAVLTPSPTAFHYQQLKLSSGLLKGGGGVEVGRDGKLRGRLAVEIRPKAALGQLPLYVGGTVAEPVLSGVPLP